MWSRGSKGFWATDCCSASGREILIAKNVESFIMSPEMWLNSLRTFIKFGIDTIGLEIATSMSKDYPVAEQIPLQWLLGSR